MSALFTDCYIECRRRLRNSWQAKHNQMDSLYGMKRNVHLHNYNKIEKTEEHNNQSFEQTSMCVCVCLDVSPISIHITVLYLKVLYQV